ncbi:MAG TPA: asparagine synthase (glutamine-hydrolyzing) [Firmicutes bacterium]|nr:asparagine synthase (glutamine-hydrolyzing) [Bacillota bacterium]
MCGIVGFVGSDKDKNEIIRKMARRIEHRGPDGEGYFVEKRIALGHKRLSIIDVEAGSQPMFNEDESLVVVFNGEIYNYLELKEELEGDGHIFKTNCDTEVLLHGYEKWERELPKHLRGMFSFAIWNKKNETLFAARDFFGIKPFYYYEYDGGLMFSSEIKAFLEHPKFEKKLNREILGPYLTFSFNPLNETFFDGVKKLPAGHYLVYKDGSLKISKYFEASLEPIDEDISACHKEISAVVSESIHFHMRSDVKVGSFLSGGVDSSYIVSESKPECTYTVGYSDYEKSEIDEAEELSRELEIENKSKKIEASEYMNIVPKVMYYMDEPLSDPAAISLYFVSKLASEDVKVVLSGEGADEFFGGYNTYREVVDLGIYNKVPYFIRHFISCVLELLPEFRGRNFLVRRGKRLEDNYVGANRLFSDKECKRILSFKPKFDNKKITESSFNKEKNCDDLAKMQIVDIDFWLTGDILHKADRMSMANSIEVRVPFVDRKVFEVAKSLPQSAKVTKENTKVAFREAARKVIPGEAYKRKKLGFPVPLKKWMTEEKVYEEIKETLSKDYVSEFFDVAYALKLLESTKKHPINCKKVWALYVFVKWYEVFFLYGEVI